LFHDQHLQGARTNGPKALETMLDVLMLGLVVPAFAVAAAYAGLCSRLGRRPDMPDENRK
jgi:hypothetical protein